MSVLPSEYHFCTYFDRNYLTRGLALYESLARHCRKTFVLWILCFDDETYDVLSRLNLPGVRLISQREFEADDEALAQVKADRSRVEYYWTCTPSLPLYILRHNPEVEVITYLDADLYFFSDLQPIYEEFGQGSILIIEHRYAPEHAHLAEMSGVYNVGWMSFRRDENGLACLHWWRDRCLEWCFMLYEDSKFGDQLYLDDWPQRFASVVVLQYKGANLAPWNLSQYGLKYVRDLVRVDGEPLIFFHFHGLRCISPGVIAPTWYDYRLSPLAIAHIFLPYVAALGQATSQAQQTFQDAGCSGTFRESCAGLLDQHLLLVRPCFVSVWLWRLAGWRRANLERVAQGFLAYQWIDLTLMRRHFLQALWRNPLILRNLGILSLLIESIVGSSAMRRYRAWRRGALSRSR
jgi:hypothetical protein